jgi:hypothetical protein
MTPDPPWLPALLLMVDHENSWPVYVEAVYAAFRRDFIDSRPLLDGRRVNCRRDPLYDNKEAGFWHCIQEGADEEERTPDLRRCERIGWIRAVIANHTAPEVNDWSNDWRGEMRRYLWLNEAYLVVLAERRHSWQLITAFCTDRHHTVRKLRRERDDCTNG